MAWQQPEFKSHRKLLAQDKKTLSEKKTINLGKPKEELEKSVVPGDDSGIFQKFE